MRVRQRSLLVVAAVLVGLALLIGFALKNGSVGPAATVTTSPSSPSSASVKPGGSGLQPCGSVPAQVTEAVDAVRNNGPYLRPRNDGGTFGNRERLLPAKPGGYYREYTVSAPEQSFPGPRRLITGGQARLGAEPEVWFYTADHYESFCELQVG